MRGPDELLELVGKLHDGVADPDIWQQALATLSGPKRDGILIRGQRKPEQHFDHADHGLPPALLDLVFPHRGQTGDLTLLMPWMRGPIRTAMTDVDVEATTQPTQSAAYRRVLQPFGLRHFLTTMLERTALQNDYLVVLRAEADGPFLPDEISTFNHIIPHLARAFRARRLLAEAQSLAVHALAALDRLDKGVVLTAADGQVRFANRAAQAMFAARDGLDAGRAGLKALRPHDTAALGALAAEAAATGAGKRSTAIGAMAVPRPSGRAPYAVVAEPLAPAHDAALDGRAEAGAIVFIGDGEAVRAPATERLRAVYDLSAAEAAVASAAFAGESVDSVAAALGVSVNTVKTHLKNVYGKVGVNRHAALAARLAADVGGIG